MSSRNLHNITNSLLENLSSKVVILSPGDKAKSEPATPATDPMVAAYYVERAKLGGARPC